MFYATYVIWALATVPCYKTDTILHLKCYVKALIKGLVICLISIPSAQGLQA